MKRIHYVLFATTLGILLSTAGCSSTEGDFLEALNADTQSKVLCVSPATLGVDYIKSTNGNRYIAKVGDFTWDKSQGIDALPALKARGYASETPEGITSPNDRFGAPKDAYMITDKIKPYINDAEEFCIGTMEATEIVDYTEVAEQGMQASQANFRYETDFNELIDDLGIEKDLVAGPLRNRDGKGEAVFTKTNKGWRLEHGSW